MSECIVTSSIRLIALKEKDVTDGMKRASGAVHHNMKRLMIKKMKNNEHK